MIVCGQAHVLDQPTHLESLLARHCQFLPNKNLHNKWRSAIAMPVNQEQKHRVKVMLLFLSVIWVLSST